ncbi:homoserine O-acetyltransferase [Sistotremastrum suecicum HHB10207 ss-3]|uniref:Homoserine O-acetyltransferase n=1 Tax=Sistotremastrum suecicum HHB10207 ss-3 TaxID=1314776 RepID=A0A166HJA8_9AGAM|nr:homoserine O-acetyltransferase [Sistotremastrum suecicum HHB10207 ss-3]
MSRFASLIQQDYLVLPSFQLECGTILKQVPIAYKTWGKLNEAKDNVMVICHAFTGSADVEDWWGPLKGPGKAFDPTRFFIICCNTMGSPYGTASPVTTNPETGTLYGPEFPSTTIRDDVFLHKHVLDHLGVRSVAVVIGGSMGGMAVLEWPLCTPKGYVRHIIPIATAARHSAWCISWGEAQRQSIYSDPAYEDGYYPISAQPNSGLAAARMSALLTYRSRDSFESRFGRKPQKTLSTAPPLANRSSSHADVARLIHNDGHRAAKSRQLQSDSSASLDESSKPPLAVPKPFSAQGYLRYQGDKFTSRFDANCYIHITRKMDTHDVARGRSTEEDESLALAEVLSTIPRDALVIGIQTDGLFMVSEQKELAEHIQGAELVIINSPDGHDGFLLEFEQINGHILRFLQKTFPDLYVNGAPVGEALEENFAVQKTSLFGEAEAGLDVTRW